MERLIKMGMDISFCKILSNDDESNICYEFNYESQLGKVPTHERIVEYYDFYETFRQYGLDAKNYYLDRQDGEYLSFYKCHLRGYSDRHHEECEDYPLHDIKIPTTMCIVMYDIEKYIYCKDVFSRWIGLIPIDAKKVFVYVSELTNQKLITKARLEELITHIPKLGSLLYDYYEVPKDLDFDFFVIDY